MVTPKVPFLSFDSVGPCPAAPRKAKPTRSMFEVSTPPVWALPGAGRRLACPSLHARMQAMPRLQTHAAAAASVPACSCPRRHRCGG